jgi:hypothetical protein
MNAKVEIAVGCSHATLRMEVMSEMHELTDTEVESVCGGVADLGKYITKAVDDALSAAIGGNTR